MEAITLYTHILSIPSTGCAIQIYLISEGGRKERKEGGRKAGKKEKRKGRRKEGKEEWLSHLAYI